MNTKLLDLCHQLGECLFAKQLRLASAESCTGGLVASSINAIAGSSQWFERGFITYSNAAKQEMLDVQARSIQRWGAVSEQVAREMALGALQHSHANISVAITGIAGPSGGTADKPVGTVWFAWAGIDREPHSECQQWQGDRVSIQQQATCHALQYIVAQL